MALILSTRSPKALQSSMNPKKELIEVPGAPWGSLGLSLFHYIVTGLSIFPGSPGLPRAPRGSAFMKTALRSKGSAFKEHCVQKQRSSDVTGEPVDN